MLDDLKRQWVRKAMRAVVGGFRPPDSPLASWFGNVLVAKPQEQWPVSKGQPLTPLCQLNLTELPFRPARLADIAFLTVFIDAERLPSEAPNGEGWLLRAYSNVDDLVPLAKPAAAWDIKPFPIRWERLEEDYPCWEDVAEMPLPPAIEDAYYDLFANQGGTKIGGWPSLIQSEISWAPFNQHSASPEYVFQIDSEAKAHWARADGGTGYFGRGTGEYADVWTLEWQCY